MTIHVKTANIGLPIISACRYISRSLVCRCACPYVCLSVCRCTPLFKFGQKYRYYLWIVCIAKLKCFTGSIGNVVPELQGKKVNQRLIQLTILNTYNSIPDCTLISFSFVLCCSYSVLHSWPLACGHGRRRYVSLRKKNNNHSHELWMRWDDCYNNIAHIPPHIHHCVVVLTYGKAVLRGEPPEVGESFRVITVAIPPPNPSRAQRILKT